MNQCNFVRNTVRELFDSDAVFYPASVNAASRAKLTPGYVSVCAV